MKYCTIKLSKFLLVNWESLQHYVIHWTSSWAVVVLIVHAYHGIFSTTIPPKCSWGWRNSSPWSTSLFCSNHGQKNDIYIYKSSQINASLIFERKFVKPIDWTLKQVTWMQGKVQTNAMGHVFFGDEKSAIDEQNCKSSLTVGGRAPGISFGQNSL